MSNNEIPDYLEAVKTEIETALLDQNTTQSKLNVVIYEDRFKGDFPKTPAPQFEWEYTFGHPS